MISCILYENLCQTYVGFYYKKFSYIKCFNGIGMLDIKYFVKIKIRNGIMYVMCSVPDFCCLGGIFGFVFILQEIEGNMELHLTLWFYVV